METKNYYDHGNLCLLITSNFAKWRKNMSLGIYPNTHFEEISISNIDDLSIKGVTFDEVENFFFQSIKNLFNNVSLTSLAIYESNIDFVNTVLSIEHLVVGDMSKVNLADENFKNLEEVTFLSVKTFKGKILEKIHSVEKLTLWYENKKANAILPMFPNLKELNIYNGSMIELDLTNNPSIENLQLHRCLKLEKVLLKSDNYFKKVIVESSKKLDVSNLGENIRIV